MLALLAALSCAADPPADPWLGRLVMLRSDDLWIGFPDAAGVPQKRANLNANSVYRVQRTNGVWLWLREKDQEGWLHQRDAVLVKDAPAFFTDRIRENSAVGKFYGRRATANQTLRRNDDILVIGTTPLGADFESALADLSEAVRLEPKTARWWGDRAWVRLQLQQWDAARDDATEAIRLEPAEADWFHRRGVAWEGKGEADIALKDFDEAIRLAPKKAAYWNSRGSLWDSSKREYRRAVADYTEAIRLDPQEAVAHSNRGSTYTELKEYDKAMADLFRASELDPHWASPYQRRGYVYRQQKDWGKATKAYTLAIEREPKDINSWGGRGYAHSGAKSWSAAEADFAECIRLDPKNTSGYTGRASCRWRQQKYADCLADRLTAEKLDPKDADNQNSIAWLQATCPEAKFRDGKSAVEHARRAAADDGKKWNYHGTLAAALAEAGDFAAAVTSQEQAISLLKAEKEPDAKAVAGCEKRLALYRDGKPYRDTGDD